MRERSLEQDLRDLAVHAKDYARAELQFQKSRITFAGKSAVSIVVWLLAALVFLFFALMALVVGAIATLAPLTTPLGATAIVLGVLAALTAMSTSVALVRWRRMTRMLEGPTT